MKKKTLLTAVCILMIPVGILMAGLCFMQINPRASESHLPGMGYAAAGTLAAAILYILSLLTAAYNDPSFTLAIDEFDAGIFEYLLGEILQAMEESGKGQFIFTSHNLRPLEVIDKKFLYFTTANPANRYIRLKKIAATNNLRDTYFREIVLNEQDEIIYKRTKRFKIVAALVQAGGRRNGQEAETEDSFILS